MKYNIAILGAGRIATKMATALNGISDRVNCYAVASRSLERAEAFASEWGFEKAYGSYFELVNDPAVDLVYIATPHSHHYEHAKLCLTHGKPALVEKAFTANETQAKEIIALSEDSGVFVQEALWTRFLPARKIIQDIIRSGALGEITGVEADFSMDLRHKERLVDPALAGGALLDLGIYSLNFASMYLGNDRASTQVTGEKYETGVDAWSECIYDYGRGVKAVMKSSFVSGKVNEGIIKGTCGSLYVRDLNNYSAIIRSDAAGQQIESYEIPAQINGYEYEVLACLEALEAGRIECEEMPHSETLEIMREMDEIRRALGVRYPFEQ